MLDCHFPSATHLMTETSPWKTEVLFNHHSGERLAHRVQDAPQKGDQWSSCRARWPTNDTATDDSRSECPNNPSYLPNRFVRISIPKSGIVSLSAKRIQSDSMPGGTNNDECGVEFPRNCVYPLSRDTYFSPPTGSRELQGVADRIEF